MLGYVIAALAVGGLGAACVYFSIIAQNVRGMNAEAEALWSDSEASWRRRDDHWGADAGPRLGSCRHGGLKVGCSGHISADRPLIPEASEQVLDAAAPPSEAGVVGEARRADELEVRRRHAR